MHTLVKSTLVHFEYDCTFWSITWHFLTRESKTAKKKTQWGHPLLQLAASQLLSLIRKLMLHSVSINLPRLQEQDWEGGPGTRRGQGNWIRGTTMTRPRSCCHGVGGNCEPVIRVEVEAAVCQVVLLYSMSEMWYSSSVRSAFVTVRWQIRRLSGLTVGGSKSA